MIFFPAETRGEERSDGGDGDDCIERLRGVLSMGFMIHSGKGALCQTWLGRTENVPTLGHFGIRECSWIEVVA